MRVQPAEMKGAGNGHPFCRTQPLHRPRALVSQNEGISVGSSDRPCTRTAAPPLAALPLTLTPQEQASLGADARRCVRCKAACQCEGCVSNHVPDITLRRHRCWCCCCCCGRLRRRVGYSTSTHTRHTTAPALTTGANASQSLSRGGGWTQEVNDCKQCRHANVLRTDRCRQGVAVVRGARKKHKQIRADHVSCHTLAMPNGSG
jgi:hypothetical protein